MMGYMTESEPFGTRLYYKEEYEKLLIKFEAELQASKNDYERMKKTEAQLRFEKQLAIAHQNNITHLKAKLAHKSRLLGISEKAHFKTIAESAALKRENAGLNHLIDRVYELLTGAEDDQT